MAESNAIAAFGTVLEVGDGGSPEVFTGIAEVHDVNGPGISLDMIERTHQLSPDATKEYIAGLKDLDNITFEIGFVPTDPTHSLTTGFLADWKNRVMRTYHLVFPDSGNTTWELKGYVSGFSIKGPTQGLLTADVTIKLTGGLTEI